MFVGNFNLTWFFNSLGSVSGPGWRPHSGGGISVSSSSQSHLGVEQMFGRTSTLFSPGSEGRSQSRTGSAGMNFGNNRGSSRHTSPAFQAPMSRVLSVYILPVPNATGISVRVPTSTSKMRKLMEHHGCLLNLQDETGAYPSWRDVDARVRFVLKKKEDEVLTLGEDGVALRILYSGPFYVGHHSNSPEASEKGKILVPKLNDPSFPSVDLSYLTVTEFGFRIPGNDKSTDYCLVLLHKRWESTYYSGKGDTRSIMDTMWDVCRGRFESNRGWFSLFVYCKLFAF